VAKTALIHKANRKPKFKVRAYSRCQRCGRPHSVYRNLGLCRICLRGDGAPRRAAGCDQVQLVTRTPIDQPPTKHYIAGRPDGLRRVETAVRKGS